MLNLSYFHQILEIVNEIDSDDKNVILNNASVELSKQILVVKEQSVIKVTNLIAKHCDLKNLESLIKSVLNSIHELIYNKHACFFVQNLLQNISLKLKELNEDKTAEKLILKIFKAFSYDIVGLSCHVYSCHVVREFICLLVGVRYEEALISARFPIFNQARIPQTAPPNPVCLKYLNLLVRKLSDDTLMDLLSSDIGCPTLFLLVRVLHLRLPKTVRKFSRLLLQMLSQLDSEWTCTDQPFMAMVVTDQRLSRILEVVLEANDDFLHFYEEFYSKCLKNTCMLYSNHSVANFVLQSFISLCPKAELIMAVDDELSGEYKNILDIGHHGIFVQFAYAYAKRGNKESQRGFVRRLADLFGVGCDSGDFINCILGMTRNEPKMNSLCITYCGSQLAQNLLTFNDPSVIVSLLLSLPSDIMKALCSHQFGSFVIEAFFKSKTVKNKNLLLKRLKCVLGVLVNDKIGSRCVDCLWEWASLKQKKFIVGAILRDCKLERLRNGLYSKYFARKAALEHFSERNDVWVSIINNKGCDLFNDIL